MTTIPPALYSHTAHVDFRPLCRKLVEQHGFRRVCDIGGGRSPLFSPAESRELGLEYIVLDVSLEELSLAPSEYRTVLADVCRIDERTLSDVDFAFSHMVAEHVRDGTAMHRQIFRILKPGGMALHMFPTLFSPVFVANRLLPDRLADALCTRLYPNKKRFPAHYSKCFGPTPAMLRLLRGLGYDVVEYRPFYGTGYLERWPLLSRLEEAAGASAAARRNPYLTSYAWLLLRKPVP